MNEWSKKDLEEMFGDDIIDQMAFVSGCYRHRLSNSDVSGWIISDEDLRKFAELVEKDVIERLKNKKNSCYTDIISDGGMDPRS
jgi:hypothetical protein